jgi:hypothetical protein
VLSFLLSAAIIALVAAAARVAFGPGPALIAAAVYATHPAAVIYDAQVLPDTLAIALLALSMLGFLRYLERGRPRDLALAALAVGLAYSAKSYFVIAAAPMVAVILLGGGDLRRRVRHVVLVGAAVTAGLLVHPVLSWAAGLPVTYAVSGVGVSDYVNLLNARPSGAYVGWRATADLVRDRFVPAARLYFGYGAVAGAILLWTTLFLAARAGRRSLASTYVLLLGGVFLAFLSLTPISLRPLAFVEILPRYISVLPPILSVAAGAALWTLAGPIRDPRLRRALAATAAVVLAYNLWVPNGMLDRGYLLQMDGLRRALQAAPRLGIEEYVVPAEYEHLVPESFHAIGPRLTFADFSDPAAALRAAAAPLSATAYFVPRLALRYLEDPVRLGEHTPEFEYGQAQALVRALPPEARRVEIRVPYDSFRVWLARAGIETKGQLVAWVVTESPRAVDVRVASRQQPVAR